MRMRSVENFPNIENKLYENFGEFDEDGEDGEGGEGENITKKMLTNLPKNVRNFTIERNQQSVDNISIKLYKVCRRPYRYG